MRTRFWKLKEPFHSHPRLTRISPIRHSPMAKVHFTFANTPPRLSPTRSHDFPQLARAHRTFINTPSGLSPIDESPPYFRQHISGLLPLANVLLAKFGNPSPSSWQTVIGSLLVFMGGLLEPYLNLPLSLSDR